MRGEIYLVALLGSTACSMLTPLEDLGCGDDACLLTCDEGRADCDGVHDNGCETELDADPNACGACGMECPGAPNAQPSCTMGSCAVACADGYVDCDGDAANGCETFVAGDTQNCGACGRVCKFDAACDAGACAVTTLVTAADALLALTTGDQQVVWSSGGQVWRLVVSASGQPQAESVFGYVAEVVDIAVSHGRAYWAAIDGVYCYPVDGSPPAIGECHGRLVGSSVAVTAVAPLGDDLYFATVAGDVKKVTLSGQIQVSPIASGQPPLVRLVVNDAWSAWTHSLPGVSAHALSLDPSVDFQHSPCAAPLGIDGEYLYFASGSELLQKELGAGAPPVVLATTEAPVTDMLLDRARRRLVWADAAGSIVALSLDQPSSQVTLVESQGMIGRLGIDADGLFFAVGNELRFAQR